MTERETAVEQPPEGEEEQVIEDHSVEDYEKLLANRGEEADQLGMKQGDIVHEPDDKAPFPMGVSELLGAGERWIYDTKTGDRSRCNANMLGYKLRERPASYGGMPRWTLTKPKNVVKREGIKCILHADDPDRAVWDGLGLPQCDQDGSTKGASGLKSEYKLRRHMEKRHKNSWEVIKDYWDDIAAEEEQKARDEEREAQRLQMEVMRTLISGQQQQPVAAGAAAEEETDAKQRGTETPTE